MMEGLVVLKIFTTRLEAEAAQKFLDSKGITALMQADGIAEEQGVQLFVLSQDLDTAFKLLQSQYTA